MSLLRLSNVNTLIGASQVLFNVSFEVKQGEALALVGRNGAGKTTVLKSIMGVLPLWSGQIFYKDRDISGEKELSSYDCIDSVSRIARMGVAWAPEDRRIFSGLTVEENLNVAKHSGGWEIDKIYSQFPILFSLKKRLGYQLSGGEKQLLSIARSLMRPIDVLLLDEPSAGLAPQVVDKIKVHLLDLKTKGLTLLVVEQDVGFIDGLCNDVVAIEFGSVRYKGSLKNYVGSTVKKGDL